MQSDTITKIIDYVFQLIAEASLSIGFIEGTGLGAVLLAVISISFIRSRSFWRFRWVELVQAWRGKSQPPAE
jgi:hypothetical protein